MEGNYCTLSERNILNYDECRFCVESGVGGSCPHLITKEPPEPVQQLTQLPMQVSKKDILGFLAFWGVQQCSTHIPFEMEKVLLDAEKHLRPTFAEARHGTISMTKKDLFKLVDQLQKLPSLRKWNLTKKEFEKGIDPDSPERENTFGIISRYDNFKEYNENDFIDLDALVRNVVNSVEHNCLKNGY